MTYGLLSSLPASYPNKPVSVGDFGSTSTRTMPTIFPGLVNLRIMVVPAARGLMVVTMALQATAANVLQEVCRQCGFSDSGSYALLHRDSDELVSLQNTVSSFQSQGDLVLVERSSLPARIFEEGAAVQVPMLEQPKYNNAMDIISSYKV